MTRTRPPAQPDPDREPQPLRLGVLSPAERRVYEVALRGLQVKEIATELHLSEATVASHLSRIYAKLGVRGRAELLARASQTPQPTSAPLIGTTPGRPAESPWPGLVVAAGALVLGVLAPLSAVVLGPALLLVGLRSETFRPPLARAVALVVGALLVGEALLVLVLLAV